MENFMDETTSDMNPQNVVRIQDLLLRLFSLRGRFKAVLPGNVARFKTQALEEDPSGKTSQLLFLLGIMLSRENDSVTMGEISRAMDVPLSTATRIVDWFVHNQYVQRLPDPDDRRIVRITWTDAGREVYQAMSAHALERAQILLTHFSRTEREQFICLMEKLANILEQEI